MTDAVAAPTAAISHRSDRYSGSALRWVVVALVAAGGGIRIFLHHGVAYSKGADEQVYADQACRIAHDGLGGYPGLVRDYLASGDGYLYPSPLRWLFVLVNSLVSNVVGCGPSTVAWVSTAAGIAMLVLVGAMTMQYLGPAVAAVATAFVASSPLQLLLGRRALGDELTGVVVLAALWCVLRYAERRSWGRLCALVAVLVAAFGTKEIVVLAYPALFLPLAVDWWRSRRPYYRDLVAVVAPPAINVIVFSVLARSTSAYGKVLDAVQQSTSSDYVRLYQHGPPQRVLVDLVALTPLVVVLALVALGFVIESDRFRPRMLAALAVTSILPYAIAPAKSVRLMVAGETLLCVLAAWALHHALRKVAPFWLTIAVVAVVISNLMVSSALKSLYDPVTVNIQHALRMGP